MKLIDGKSVLLGMGLGIIITSILGVIFFAGYKPQLTDMEIIRLAQRIGMIDRFQGSGDVTRKSDGSLIFTIQTGETSAQISERLYEAGIIQSSIEFEIMLKKDSLENKIKPGEYTISYDDDAKSIINRISGSQ